MSAATPDHQGDVKLKIWLESNIPEWRSNLAPAGAAGPVLYLGSQGGRGAGAGREGESSLISDQI